MKRTHRKKELTEVQVLKKENRELKSEIRELKRDVRRLQKQEHFHENTRLDEEAEQMILIEETDKTLLCPSCFKGDLIEMNVVGRHWFECNQCDYDTRKIKK